MAAAQGTLPVIAPVEPPQQQLPAAATDEASGADDQPDEAAGTDALASNGDEAGAGLGGSGSGGLGQGGIGTGGEGSGRGGRRPAELAGRVIGAGPPSEAVEQRQVPYVSLQEATDLRQYDFFPRLPAAAWRSPWPYRVMLDVCVSASGSVSHAAFTRRASPALDPVVLSAVRTWRYRPRLVDGRATPFCHSVAIEYDR